MLFVIIISVPLALFSIALDPQMQTITARYAAAYLSKEFNSTIRIKKLSLTPLLKLHLHEMYIEDKKEDTLLFTNDLKARFKFPPDFNTKIDFTGVEMKDATFKLHRYENDSVFNINTISDFFKKNESDSLIMETPSFSFIIGDAELENIRFFFIDDTKTSMNEGIDYQNLYVDISELEVQNIRIRNDSIFSEIKKLSCIEKSGLEIKSLSGDFVISPKCLLAENMMLTTKYSEIGIDIRFTYNDWKAYKDFIDDVHIYSEIRKSVLNLRDIGYFAPAIASMDNPVRIGGIIKGKVSNFKAKGFRFAYGKSTHFQGDIGMNGLPDIENTYMHLKIKEFEIAQNDIETFVFPIEGNYIKIPETLSQLGNLRTKGSFTGFFNNFVSFGSFKTDLGKFSTDLIVKQNPGKAVAYDGKITAEQFNIGKFLNLENYLGNFSISALIDGSGLQANDVNLNINGIVDSLEFMGNNFNKIEVKGELSDKKFNGNTVIVDELVKLVFNGMVDFNSSIPIFDFTADVDNAKLYELNMGKRYQDMELSTLMRCNFIGYKLDDIEGRINIDSTVYIENNKKYFLERFALITLKDTGLQKKLMLASDVFNATVEGAFMFKELIPSFVKTIDKYIESEYIGLEEPEKIANVQNIDYEILLKDTKDITELFIPDLKIWNNTDINGKYNTGDNSLTLNIKSEQIQYKGLKFNKMQLNASTKPNDFIVRVSTDNLKFKENSSDSLDLGIDSLKFASHLKNDSLLFNIQWNDGILADRNIGDIEGYVAFLDTAKIYTRLTKADVIINDSSWTISKDNYIYVDNDEIEFNDFRFIGKTQELGIEGIISDKNTDTLDVRFRHWHISNFDIAFNQSGFDMDGIINGKILMSGIKGVPNFNSNIHINTFKLNKVLLGDAKIMGQWDKDEKCVDMDIEIDYIGNIGTSKTLDLAGKYYPYDDKRNFNIDFSIENFKLKSLRPFTESFMSKLSGVASGKVRLKGSLDNPFFNGNIKLMRTSFVINYLNTKYSLAHTINIDSTGFNIEDLTVYDSLGNTATCTGKISHNRFKDFRVDVEIAPQDFICFNTNRYQNNTFYGSAIASGNIRINGPFDDIFIDIDASTSKGTDIYVPLSSTSSLSQNNYIVFVNNEKDTSKKTTTSRQVKLKGLSLSLRAKVNNEAEIQIYLPENMGNITSRGKGDLSMSTAPGEDFKIRGDYTIDRGSFLFKIQNLLRKKFELMSGGKINFSGNPLDATINARALYKVKTSLSGISSNLDEMYGGERVNVDCILHLKERLMNPEINFTIRFPNLDTDIKQYVYAVIDTNNQAIMNQQMISLLVLNSFSYNTTGNIGSSSFNIISNQLSNWLSQISRDFDVGINYRPGDELTEDEIQVALSTQLFDDRLIIDGNLGVSSDRNQQDNASNIVGDVNIEYKLTRDGRIRLRAFNRSNNINSIDDISPYTQGVGIFYRKEFGNFADLFRKRKIINQQNLIK